MGKPTKLAVVVTHPIQYHACLWRALAADPDIDCKVLFCSGAVTLEPDMDRSFGRAVKWDVPLLDGYTHAFYRNWSPFKNSSGFLGYFNPGLLLEIVTGGYDFLYVHLHNAMTHPLAMLIAKLMGKRVLVRSISYNLGERTGPVRWLRKAIYTPLFALGDCFLYTGTHNKAFFRSFGVPERRLIHAPHVVDNQFFSTQDEVLKDRHDELKKGWAIPPDQRVILFCAKFILKKQPLLMLEAYFRAALGEDWVLLMVGDGELRPKMEEEIRRHPESPVVLTGFLNQSEISKAYAISDILVLPSQFQETWGLVVNEAMNFGCAILASDRVGCAPELVEGKSGTVFPHNSAEDLARILRTYTSAEALLKRAKDRATETISSWNVDSFVAAVRRCLGLA